MPDEPEVISDVKPTDGAPSTPSDVKPKAEPSAAPAKTLADVVKETAAASLASQPDKSEGNEPEKPDEKVAPVEAKEGSEETDETKETDEDGKPKLGDENLPFNKHPRFQELIKERNEFKQKIEQYDPAIKRDAALSDYCQKNGITNDEFVNAMEVAALLHNEPKKALETLKQYVETLELTLGNKLPADLQKEVEDGILSEERAKELANLRVKSQGLEYTGKKSEAQVVQERQKSIATAVNSWEASKKTSDPAYDKKYPLIERAFVAACSLTPPRSPAEAVALVEKAYAEVNTALGTLVPKPPTRKVLRTNGATIKTAVEIKPGTPLREALPLIAKGVVAAHRE